MSISVAKHKIKEEIKKIQFLEYFNKNYLLKYNVNNWNYYENIEHLSESYNSY